MIYLMLQTNSSHWTRNEIGENLNYFKSNHIPFHHGLFFTHFLGIFYTCHESIQWISTDIFHLSIWYIRKYYFFSVFILLKIQFRHWLSRCVLNKRENNSPKPRFIFHTHSQIDAFDFRVIRTTEIWINDIFIIYLISMDRHNHKRIGWDKR